LSLKSIRAILAFIKPVLRVVHEPAERQRVARFFIVYAGTA